MLEHCFKAMGGPCRVVLHGDPTALEAAISEVEAEVRRLENRYSRYLDDSLTSRINAAAGSGNPTPIDSETAGLLHYVDTLWRESGQLFDLTSGILRRAWDFRSGKLPSQATIDELLPLIGWGKVQWSDDSIYLPRKGMELDFGGCVKEYACDSAARALRGVGITSGLVDLAGDMLAIGTRPGGEDWQIGIRHPVNKASAIARVALRDSALASSGDYERCIEIGGRRLGHILSPLTGWPVEGGLTAVSVIAGQCLVAGSSATVAMLKPADEALDWLEKLGLPWLAIDSDLNCHGTIVQPPDCD
jgi:thiamine biosynthesis lipoprotein